MTRSWLMAPQAVMTQLAPPLLVALTRRGQSDVERRTPMAAMVAPPVQIAQAIYEGARRVVRIVTVWVRRFVARPVVMLFIAAGLLDLPPPGAVV